jgi:catechol 2,3-dioxygenase-like lactoylglutathione lyase family enzyme
MPHHVHHVHLLASDIEKSLAFYKTFFGGEVVLDMEIAGAGDILIELFELNKAVLPAEYQDYFS